MSAAELACVSCGRMSGPLSSAQTCSACEAAAERRKAAADELRAWKRYPTGLRGTAGYR